MILRNRKHARQRLPNAPITLPKLSDVKAAGQNELPSNAPCMGLSASSADAPSMDPSAPVDVMRKPSHDSMEPTSAQTPLANANRNSSMESNTD
jgi:hypothetical protein